MAEGSAVAAAPTDAVATAAHAISSRRPNWWLITPLAFTTLPLIRHLLVESTPRVRHTAYGLAVGAGLLHGVLTMTSASSVDSLATTEETFYSPAQLSRRESGGVES